MNTTPCPNCKTALQAEWNFCPHRGHKQKENLSTSAGKQFVIYFVSFFLAPLGLWWGIKYVRSTDKKTRSVGIVSIVLTITSLALMILTVKIAMDEYLRLLNTLSPELLNSGGFLDSGGSGLPF